MYLLNFMSFFLCLLFYCTSASLFPYIKYQFFQQTRNWPLFAATEVSDETIVDFMKRIL